MYLRIDNGTDNYINSLFVISEDIVISNALMVLICQIIVAYLLLNKVFRLELYASRKTNCKVFYI
jgi:hypothetical protein